MPLHMSRQVPVRCICCMSLQARWQYVILEGAITSLLDANTLSKDMRQLTQCITMNCRQCWQKQISFAQAFPEGLDTAGMKFQSSAEKFKVFAGPWPQKSVKPPANGLTDF